ncbi:sensor histidine kinase [Parvularcula marina]|uniref:sensor histidine kinase n=1 Tax=Parvularcula marina TaxID=2292771 RepID=UPI00351411C5
MPTRFKNTSLSHLAAALDQLCEGVIVTGPTGALQFVNRAAEELHGVSKLDVEPDDYAEAYQLLTMEGEPYPSRELPLARAVLDGEHIRDSHWRIRRPDGSEIVAVGSAHPVTDETGERIGAVLTLRDDTERLAKAEELAEAIKLKEALLFEVNHRVKNTLQLVSSLINLQSKRIEDRDAQDSMRNLTSRVNILTGIHQRLYEVGTHDRIEISNYLRGFLTSSLQALAEFDTVELNFEAEGDLVLPVDQAVSIALLMNELMLNSLKHAFHDTAEPTIRVAIRNKEGRIRIDYSDNGCGIASGESKSKSSGIGIMLVSSLARQLRADVEETGGPTGYGMSLTFAAAEVVG